MRTPAEKITVNDLLSKSPVTERVLDRSDGGFYLVKTQRCDDIIKAISELPDHTTRHRVAKSNMRYIGSVPNVLAVQWAREAGVRLFSREFKEVVKKKLQEPEFRRLKVQY